MKLKLGEREKNERTESMKCIYKNDLVAIFWPLGYVINVHVYGHYSTLTVLRHTTVSFFCKLPVLCHLVVPKTFSFFILYFKFWDSTAVSRILSFRYLDVKHAEKACHQTFPYYDIVNGDFWSVLFTTRKMAYL